jgi:hypothetical protein
VEYHKTIIGIIKRKTFNSTHTNLNNNMGAQW